MTESTFAAFLASQSADGPTIPDETLPEIDGTPTEGDDTIIGTADGELIEGLGGNDVIEGRGGDDTLEGGDDNDTITSGDGRDIVLGGEGDDVLINPEEAPRAFQDLIYGGPGNDVLIDDSAQATALDGEGGNDILVANGLNAVMTGGPDADLFLPNTDTDDLPFDFATSFATTFKFFDPAEDQILIRLEPGQVPEDFYIERVDGTDFLRLSDPGAPGGVFTLALIDAPAGSGPLPDDLLLFVPAEEANALLDDLRSGDLILPPLPV